MSNTSLYGDAVENASETGNTGLYGGDVISVNAIQGIQGPQGTQGVQGVQGIQGLDGLFAAQGIQGIQGQQGIQGRQGVQGVQGIIGIGVQGIQGNQGIQGIFGIQGTQGAQGTQGLDGQFAGQGIQGIQGIDGNQGIQGQQGIQGRQGTQGVQGRQGIAGQFAGQGIQGPQGTQGAQGRQGVQGNQAAQGVQGPQGNQGRQGLQGIPGSFAGQGIQGIQGVTGTGLQGTQGAQGTDGAFAGQGVQGADGPQGVQGIQGLPGQAASQGIQGFQGPQGLQGRQGVQGIQGNDANVQGIQGIQGLQGIQGVQGIIGNLGPSSNLFNYFTNTTISGGNPGSGFIAYNVPGATRTPVVINAYATAAISTAQSKFGGSSLETFASEVLGAYSPSNIGYAPGLNGWTVEAWVYVTNISNTPFLWDTNTTFAFVNPLLVWSSTDVLTLYPNGAATLTVAGASTYAPLNAWNLISVVYDDTAGTLNIYINGINRASTAWGFNYGSWALAVSGFWPPPHFPGQGVDAYWNDFRISNIARYSTNFSVPVSPFVNDGNTVCLFPFNGTNGSQSFPDNNGSGNQTSSTNLYLSTTTNDGFSVGTYLSFLGLGNKLVIKDNSNATNFQVFDVTASVTDNTSYYTVPVVTSGSGGTGTTNFANNLSVNLSTGGGVQGAQGIQGTIGSQGIQGQQGPQGIQGIQGEQGVQGIQGIDGNQGIQGIQGIQGTQGSQGSQGIQGRQGNQGIQGISGAFVAQGIQGIQGIQGLDGQFAAQGIQGTQGLQGNQGRQGIQGLDGQFAAQGIQGIQGIQGLGLVGQGVWNGNSAYAINDWVDYNGEAWVAVVNIPSSFPISNPAPPFSAGQWSLLGASQGIQGIQGGQGIQGAQGTQGTQGAQGIQGIQGTQGNQGVQGTQGITGQAGQSNSLYNYQARTNIQTGNPGNGNIIWNNVTQSSATELNFSHIDGNNDDIDFLLALILPNDVIRIQDQNDSTRYQVWTVSGSITELTGYVTIPVTLVSSTFSFTNTQQIIAIIRSAGVTGAQGIQGIQGHQGIQGFQGISGITGNQGIQGSQGAQGITGSQGAQGIQGIQGIQSIQGIQGITGTFGGTLTQNLDVNGFSIISSSNGTVAIAPNGTGRLNTSNLNYNEGAIYDNGTVTSSTLTPSISGRSMTQKVSIAGSSFTLNPWTSAAAGDNFTLIITNTTTITAITQGTGTWKWAGGSKALTGTASSVDIVSVYYDGTVYYGSINKGFA